VSGEKTPEQRADDQLGGITLRANEHRWSQKKYTRQANRLIVPVALASGAVSSGGVAALTGDPTLAPVGLLIGALAGFITKVAKLTTPDRKAKGHARAASRFDVVATAYRTFLARDAHLPPKTAWKKFDAIDKQRQAVVGDCERREIFVEPDAKEACRRV
jgi:hypothetical protein